MKNNLIKLNFLLLGLSLAFTSCTKEGIGGKGEIKGYATHAADADGKFNFKELNKGNYYIHAVGTENGVTMTGGTNVELTKDQIKDNVEIGLNP
jgi:hypothetical protein